MINNDLLLNALGLQYPEAGFVVFINIKSQ